MIVNMLVEGVVDEAVARRLIAHCGHESGIAYGKRGWRYIEQRVASFNAAVGSQPLLTLVDLMDTGIGCAPKVVATWLPHRRPNSVLRVVVREIESWVLADRRAVAAFLDVALQKVPLRPEALTDPKRSLVNLARHSRTRAIREALVPRANYAASEGPLYSSELCRFIATVWSPDAAATCSASLAKCVRRLNELGV